MGSLKFTIYHGFVASLALHSALGLPFVLHDLAAEPEEPPTLVVELQGPVAESQAQQKTRQETAGAATQDKTAAAKPAQTSAATSSVSDDPPGDLATDEKAAVAPPPEPGAVTQPGNSGSINAPGADEQQNAQSIKKDREEDAIRLKAYGKLVTKKVHANLVYPEDGRQAGLKGVTTISFVILATGQIRPETLKVIATSGQPKLDASALQSVRSSAPFEPPPREMTMKMFVDFGRKR